MGLQRVGHDWVTFTHFQYTLFTSNVNYHPSAFHNISTFSSGLTGLISLLSKRLSKVFSSIIVGKPQFFSTQPSQPSKNAVFINNFYFLIQIPIKLSGNKAVTETLVCIKILFSYNLPHTRQPDLPLEKSVCRSESNS